VDGNILIFNIFCNYFKLEETGKVD